MGDKILDWQEYIECARKVAAEGIVLLKNENHALPYKKNSKVAIFGRIQNHYYKSGTGSGGMVNVSKVIGIVDGLLEDGSVELNQDLRTTYEAWEMEHPFCEGIGWGTEPWAQEEMEVSEELVRKAAKESEHALIIIGRTAGEDHDNMDEPGAYRLTALEEDMIKKVRKEFLKVSVVLNVGNIMDMSFVDSYQPDAVLYAWQGGMIGGYGVADVLTGKVSPSGKLSDTIAYSIKDYPSDGNFGNNDFDYYVEDIYVGYRYFETVAKNKVRYPFGFGLSYSDFMIRIDMFEKVDDSINLTVVVKNIGNYSGKEVVQIYAAPPQGRLGKPKRNLISFQKTILLRPFEEQSLHFCIGMESLASYDETGITGHKSCMVLEEGTYVLFAGSDVRNATKAGVFTLPELLVTKQLEEALAPRLAFQRMKPKVDIDGEYQMQWEEVPLGTINMTKRRKSNLPETIPYTEDKGIRLKDVLEEKASMDEFVAQLSDEDLSCIIRGEGMGSTKVTPGTAAAFGGVSPALQKFGIPCGCCTDGPSGMRLDTGIHAFSLPNGTLIACTFNEKLVEELFTYTGIEMLKNKIEVLLGPGMNIHRHPLNGRNFEYFSEDPYLTGIMATAELKGLKKSDVTGSLKHFCGNNQETYRHDVDSVISERALREIYLKGFEITVKAGVADAIMTTYGAVNGLWTAGSYDLVTKILRDQWGFSGIVMTDWWAKINEEGMEANKTNFAAMAAAQNDLYMVCSDGSVNTVGDNTLVSLKSGSLSRGELQRCAKNICRFLMHSHAMKRFLGQTCSVDVINRPTEEEVHDDIDMITYKVEDELTIPLKDVNVKKDGSYPFGLDLKNDGEYKITITGRSSVSQLAQIPVSFIYAGTPIAMFTWNGTKGEWVSIENKVFMETRIHSYKLSFRQNGLELKDMKITLLDNTKES